MNYPQQGYGQPAQQYPPQAQPQYAPPPAAPAYPPQYPPAQQPQYQPQQYQPQQQYPTQFAPPQPPQQPQAPVIRGTLAGAYEQGVRTGGYGNTCKFMAPGHRKGGYVARDMTDLDVTAETDYATKAPKPDGRGGYRMQMTIPLNVQPGAEHPEGKTTVWAKGRLLTAVVHAMLAVGYDINAGDALKEGDFLDIQRVADVPTNKGNPAHDFVVTVTRAGQAVVGGPVADYHQQALAAPGFPSAPAATPTPTGAPVAGSPYPTAPPAAFPAPSYDPTAQYQAQAAQLAAQAGMQYAPPAPPTQYAPAPAAPQPPAPAPSYTPGQATAPGNGQPGLDPYQDALVKQITGQQLTQQEAEILAAGPPQR